MIEHWILDDNGLPMPADEKQHMEFYRRGPEARRIARDDVDGQDVSTVFLAVNHAWFGGPPLLFETMIFGGPHDEYCERYDTRANAEAGHARVVAALREGRDPEADRG